MTRLEVWGDPIAHSLSPRLHAAAYAQLGWDWQYGRRQVDAAGFTRELASSGADLRGVSLTFPLKAVGFEAATTRDHFAELTGAVNTLLLTGAQPRGFNTDVGGIIADLGSHGVHALESARIVGAGATATSALVALGELGAAHVEVIARRPAAAAPLVTLGERIGVRVDVTAMDASAARPSSSPAASPSVTISTLPGGAEVAPGAAAALAQAGGLLYDVVYGHWPTALAAAWTAAGGTAANGLGMLLQQAVRQIRIFGTGDADEPLPHEADVVAVMGRALMED